MGIWDWSKTANSNTSLEGISWATGMAPGTVDNGVRAIVAALKEYQEDTGGALTSGGAANAYTLTTNGTIPSLGDGQMVGFIANHSNTGAATLNVDSKGAKAIRKGGDVALASGDIPSGMVCLVSYDASANGAAGAWLLHNPYVNPASYQPLSAGLTDLSTRAASAVADRGTYYTAANTTALFTFTVAGRALLDDADASAQRTTLGLGTSATVNTGTSGATIPLLNGANTWSTTQTLTVAPVFTDQPGTRTALGLAIGTNVQAYSAGLADLSTRAAAAVADRGIYYTAANTSALYTFTAAGRALLDDADASAQRTTLGLTTAATTSIGTSGATIPLNNAANIWDGVQSFQGGGGAPALFKWTNDGAAAGPYVSAWRDSITPAANDEIAVYAFDGNDSGGNYTTYGQIVGQIIDPTNGSEDFRLQTQTRIAGTLANRHYTGAGFYMAGTTDMGAGTGNFTAVYKNGVEITVPTTWTLRDTATAAASASLDFTDLGSPQDVMIVFRNVVKSAALEINMRVSSNNGSSFYAGATDYYSTTTAAATEANLTPSSATTVTVASFFIAGFGSTVPIKFFQDINDTNTYINRAEALNAIRVLTSSGTLTSGTIEVWGR